MFAVQKNPSYMKEILSNIRCHTFFLIRKWSITVQMALVNINTLSHTTDTRMHQFTFPNTCSNSPPARLACGNFWPARWFPVSNASADTGTCIWTHGLRHSNTHTFCTYRDTLRHMAVPGRNRTLFWNAIIKINTIKNFISYHSLAATVQQL